MHSTQNYAQGLLHVHICHTSGSFRVTHYRPGNSLEVDLAEENGQHHTVVVQHASGNTVVHRLQAEEGEELVIETIAT